MNRRWMSAPYILYKLVVLVLALSFLWLWKTTKPKECIERTLDGLVIERLCSTK